MAKAGRPKKVLTLTAEARTDLERYERGRPTGQALAFRARIVLLCATGKPNTTVARELETEHWSSRKMAKQAGVSQSSVSRIWRAFQLKPHRTRTFTLSTDPFFTEKVRDIVGLYLNPPDDAVVLCVDEKPAVQALERTQSLLSGRRPPIRS